MQPNHPVGAASAAQPSAQLQAQRWKAPQLGTELSLPQRRENAHLLQRTGAKHKWAESSWKQLILNNILDGSGRELQIKVDSQFRSHSTPTHV